MNATAATDSAASTARQDRAYLSRVSTPVPVLPRHPVGSSVAAYLVKKLSLEADTIYPIWLSARCTHVNVN